MGPQCENRFLSHLYERSPGNLGAQDTCSLPNQHRGALDLGEHNGDKTRRDASRVRPHVLRHTSRPSLLLEAVILTGHREWEGGCGGMCQPTWTLPNRLISNAHTALRTLQAHQKIRNPSNRSGGGSEVSPSFDRLASQIRYVTTVKF